MLCICNDFSRIIPQHADRMKDICSRILQLPGAEKVVLFGSYAKGEANRESDIDLAVFFRDRQDCLLEQYRQLTRICVNPFVDIQAQPFHADELCQPCGIIDEVVTYGIELQVC